MLVRGGRVAFTLIEAMIVTVIVGIIAVLATVGYRKWVIQSHEAEAQDVVSNIRQAEEAFKAENGAYVTISAGLEPPNMYPQASPVGSVTTQWGGPCGTCTGAWTTLNVAPSAPVVFGYAVVSGSTGVKTPSFSYNGSVVDTSTLITQPWYVVEAYCDLDSQGAPNMQIYGLSSSNQLLMNNEGQ
jgi:Tfp pilus assembly protein PilE